MATQHSNPSRRPSRPRTQIFAVLLASTVLAACTLDTGDSSEDPSVTDRALSSECDRSPYNCKLPASHKDRNRIFNYATNSYDWPIASGTDMLDGLGNFRGHVAGKSVLVNFGGRKRIAGVNHIYAFAAKLDTGIHASSWVRESALAHGPIARMPTVALHDPGQGDYATIWTVTGGDNSQYEGLKVIKAFTGSNGAATDYLVRPGNMFNLLYNLPGSGGVATDTFPLNVPFRRSKGVPQLGVNLYHPGGTNVVGTMKFVYGHVGDRYGWVARAALATTGSPGTCYVRCCDGTLQGPHTTDGAAACHQASKALCDARGHVKRSEFNGVEVYKRSSACGPTEPPAEETQSVPPSEEEDAVLPPGEDEPAPDPAENTEPSTPAPDPAGQCYVRCCNGTLHGPLSTADAPACHETSKGVCADLGHVKRSEFNGAEVFSRPRACWAKCANREAYHEVAGVTQDCTAHAKAYCAVGDRGAFQDAMWNECQP